MARKRKGELPSGSIRYQLYVGTDATGKKIYKSFTAQTRTEAKAMAAEWKSTQHKGSGAQTLAEAAERFVELNAAYLSPTTVKTYRGYVRALNASKIGAVSAADVTSQDVQAHINELCFRLAPKTVKNHGVFMLVVLDQVCPDRKFRVKFPAAEHKEKHIPSREEIAKAYAACNCVEMRLAFSLALDGMMRRGEVCALQFEDIDFKKKTAWVHRSLALTEDNVYVEKAPKTKKSNRVVDLTDRTISLIKETGRTSGRILGFKPSDISNRLEHTISRAKIEPFSFHALRHVSQSIMIDTGAPASLAEDVGGWERGSDVRVKNYDHVVDSKARAAYMRKFHDALDFLG